MEKAPKSSEVTAPQESTAAERLDSGRLLSAEQFQR